MGERGGRDLAFRLECVDPQIERRTSCKRGALCGTLLAEHPGKLRIEPFRIVADDPGRGAIETGRSEPRLLLRAQRRRSKAPAIGERRDRIGIELALEPQHSQGDRARALVSHDVGARRPPAKRVINEACDRRAIARPGEPVHEAPVLERLAGRTALRLEIGEDLDGGGEARSGSHPSSSRMRRTNITHMAASTTTPDAKSENRNFSRLLVMWT